MFAKGTDSVIFLAKGKTRQNLAKRDDNKEKIRKNCANFSERLKNSSLRLLLAKIENLTVSLLLKFNQIPGARVVAYGSAAAADAGAAY